MYKQACMCGSYKALWHTFLWCLCDFTSSAISSTILVNTANCSSSHNFKFSNCACIEHSHPTEVPYMIACAIIILLKNTIMYVYTHMQTYTHTTLLVRSLSCGVDCPCCLGIEDDASSGSPTSERYPSPREGREITSKDKPSGWWLWWWLLRWWHQPIQQLFCHSGVLCCCLLLAWLTSIWTYLSVEIREWNQFNLQLVGASLVAAHHQDCPHQLQYVNSILAYLACNLEKHV